MEIDEFPKSYIKCFKSNIQCLGPLNIDYNASNTTFILWNKYEIYVYENLKFESASKSILPEFQICYLISSNNIIACLDVSGNVYTTPMKFKQAVPKRFKTFLLREKCVLSCTLYTSQKILSLKLEHNTNYLCINNLNTEFELEKKIKLIYPQENSQQSQKEFNAYILQCYDLHEHYDNLIKTFNINKELCKDYNFIIISFDRRVLYGCVYSLKEEVSEIVLLDLFSAPSRICDVKVTEADHGCLLISLAMGTLIRLSLSDFTKVSDIAHLNATISKSVPFNESIIYTDGMSLWKCNDTFTSDINFQQFLVKQVKDFICFGDQILCTTYTNLIYLFNIDNETSYVKTSLNEYYEARKVLNETGYAYKILEEVENNRKLEEKIKEESNYITALSLSNRPDLLNNEILYSILVYNSYEDVLKESISLTLTDKIKEFFAANILCLLIKITLASYKQGISDVLLKILRDLQIHITILSKNKIIKITTVRIDELKSENLLIPLHSNAGPTVRVQVKIVKRIPGMQHKEILWTIIHQKEIILNSEHFINSNAIKNNITELKEPEKSHDELINQIAYKNNEHLFQFTDIENKQTEEFSFYVKLPNNFEEAFKNESYYKMIFNKEKALYLLKENISDDFLNATNKITFEIGNIKVIVEISNYEFTESNSLKVTCDNLKIGFDIRNFYSNLAYDNFSKYEPNMEFIKYPLYATIENIQKGIKQSISEGNEDKLKMLLEELQRYVFGAMPL